MTQERSWIASYPKSGNTWMRIMLANLINGGEEPVPLLELGSYVPFSESEFRYKWALGKYPAEVDDPWEVHAARDRVRERLVGPVKTHAAMLKERGVWHADPRKSVYIVRDPRDVCISFAHHADLSHEDVATMLAGKSVIYGWPVWVRLLSWSRHFLSWRRTLSPEQLRIVRYEDMKACPEMVLTEVAWHLGLPDDAERVARAVENSRFEICREQEERDGFGEASPGAKFFRRGKAGAWRDELDPALARKIETAHHKVMARCKYLDAEG